MNKVETSIPGVFIIEPVVYFDKRGWFMESYNQIEFSENGLHVVFIQDNHSLTMKSGCIRGIHYQARPYWQTKLVRCINGRVLDIIVDLRIDSPTYLSHVKIEISSKNKKQVYIPKGCGHAFISLEDDSEVEYKVDIPYRKEFDRAIRFDDPNISIDWPTENAQLSEKDLDAPYISEIDKSEFTSYENDGEIL